MSNFSYTLKTKERAAQNFENYAQHEFVVLYVIKIICCRKFSDIVPSLKDLAFYKYVSYKKVIGISSFLFFIY